MAGRDLTVRIRAEISDFNNKIRAAKAGIVDFNNEVAKSAQKRQALNDVGTAFGKMGLLAAAGLGASAKAAMDWETAWTGVRKTVDGSAREMAALEDQLRQMARTMPATHQEIAAVAEAAGQMGVAVPEIASFTKTMVQLGETTNLSADEAATAIGQMKAIMGTTAGEVDNLAATIVALGNSGESTERDIVQLAQGMAGAAKIVGMTEGELLAISSALSSVGIGAEAGSTSVSKIFIDMAKAAKTGSPDLEVWAATAEKGGLATGTFTKAMADSPAQAFDAFTKGLAAIDAEGGDVFTLLADLGQSDARVTKSLLGMAGSGDKLAKALMLQGDAWQEQSAHTDEYGRRVETAASKAQIAWNGIKDNGIDIGNSVLPVVKDLSDTVTSLADGFGELPKPVQDATGKLLALTALLGGGVFVGSRVITGIASTRTAMDQLGISMGKMHPQSVAFRGAIAVTGVAIGELIRRSDEGNRALGTLGGAVGGAAAGAMFGPWGAAIGGAAGALAGFADANRDAAGQVDALRDTLDEQTGSITKNTEAFIANKLEKSGALAAAGRQGIPGSVAVGAARGDPAAEAEFDRLVAARRRKLQEAAQFSPTGTNETPYPQRGLKDLAKLQSEVRGVSGNLDKAQASARRMGAALNGLKPAKVEQIAEATRRIPKSVITKFTTPGAPNAVKNTAEVLANTEAMPKDIKLALELAGWKDQKQIDAVVAQVAELRKNPKTEPKLEVNDRATPTLRRILNNLSGIKSKEITVTTRYRTIGSPPRTPYTGGIAGDFGFNSGGVVPGTSPSDPREDNVPAALQDGRRLAVRSGEWIINEPASRLNDRYLRAINNGLDMNKLLPGFNSGGRVGGSSSSGGPMQVEIVSANVTVNGLEARMDNIVATRLSAESRMSRAAASRRRG